MVVFAESKFQPVTVIAPSRSVYDLLESQTATLGAGSERRVEREQLGFEFGYGYAAVGAGVFGVVQRFRAVRVHYHHAVGEPERALHGVGQALFHALFHLYPVHNHAYGVTHLLIEVYILVEVAHFAVYFDAHVTLFFKSGKLLSELALLAARYGREYHELRPLGVSGHSVYYLVYRLLLHGLTALVAIHVPRLGIEQTQVVVYLRHRAHGGTRVMRSRLLVNGDSGRKTLYRVHVRLVHYAEELARV